MQLRTATTGYAGDQEVLMELVTRLGGPHAVVEQLTAVLERGEVPALGDVGPDTPGYCYLRLFDGVEHRDAVKLGCRPTVADVRRFSNGRADPFGTRLVTVTVQRDTLGRLAHVQFHGGAQGLRPVEALASLSKDCQIGALPDGVSEEFPPDWIPAKRNAVQTWDFLRPGESARALDVLEWLGAEPPWLDRLYEPLSASTTRLRWTLRANPLGPPTSTLDIVDPNGKVSVVRSWSSNVAHTGYHQNFKVRGNRVFVDVMIWRAAKVLTDPTSPAPAPTPEPGHGDLLVRARSSCAGVGLSDVRVISSAGARAPGFCYASAFTDSNDAVLTLGAYPTVDAVREYALRSCDGKPFGANPAAFKDAWITSGKTHFMGSSVLHIEPDEQEGSVSFWQHLERLDGSELLGATQSDVIRSGTADNTSLAPTLAVRPRGAGTLMTVPFVALLGTGKETLYWDISAGKKFAALASYFESVEMVSLRAKVTVHRGDNDTMVTLVADSVERVLIEEIDWVGAAHTLHVSGNTNGATTGELVLEGNHGFGIQLKGTAVGNPTPIIQAKLETSVVATAYIKFLLTVRVAGTGIPVAMALPTKPAKGGLNGAPRAGKAADDGSGDD